MNLSWNTAAVWLLACVLLPHVTFCGGAHEAVQIAQADGTLNVEERELLLFMLEEEKVGPYWCGDKDSHQKSVCPFEW